MESEVDVLVAGSAIHDVDDAPSANVEVIVELNDNDVFVGRLQVLFDLGGQLFLYTFGLRLRPLHQLRYGFQRLVVHLIQIVRSCFCPHDDARLQLGCSQRARAAALRIDSIEVRIIGRTRVSG